MTRWYVEKDGTGIEKSGTGMEKSGTGIEKSGTGIEKSGTGIEKSGTGLRKSLLAFSLTAIAFVSNLGASELAPTGTMLVVAENQKLAVTWVFEGSIFGGIASINGSAVNLQLTETTLLDGYSAVVDTTGGGTGSSTKTTGGGTGSSSETTGGGTGSRSVSIAGDYLVQTTGGGTGASIETTGGGTGSSTDTTGGGTGSATDTTGGGTGSNTDTTGGGTGSKSIVEPNQTIILTTGGGTGSDAIAITLPGDNSLQMEVLLGCNTATVSVLDAGYAEVVSFTDVPVHGTTGFCNESSIDPFDDKALFGQLINAGQ